MLMDDLQLIREVLDAPAPSARTTVQARNRLTAAIAGPHTRRRRPWVRTVAWSAGGAAALAAITAVALATTVTTSGSPAPPRVAVPVPAPLSAHDLLLAAADQAASADTGRYWHVQEVAVTGSIMIGTGPDRYELTGGYVSENWIARDPRDKSYQGYRELGWHPRTDADRAKWRAAGSPTRWDISADNASGHRSLSTQPGTPRLSAVDPAQSYLRDLGGFDLAQVQQLPTDPAALRDLIVARIAAGPDGRALSTDEADLRLFGALTELLLDVPAPPKVRAAAFRALAGIPGVTSSGQVADARGRTGVGIELIRTGNGFREYRQLIFDGTSHLILADNYAATDAGGHRVKDRTMVILEAEWTDGTPVPPAIS
jgi:hypothetical protein